MSIHFICRGNVLRSLITETYLKSLGLNDVTITSSGTVADTYRVSNQAFFISTVDLLNRHGLESYVKNRPEQLTQERTDNIDLTICMNQIVIDEANSIVLLPKNTVNWNVSDIGEGKRIIQNNRQTYEEEIYQEIIKNVDELVDSYNLV